MSVLQGLQSSHSKLRALHVRVFGIVVDSYERNLAVRDKFKLDFEILSDPRAQAIRAYGLLHEKAPGIGHDISRPATYLLDRRGKIIRAWITENYRVRVRVAQIIQAISEHERVKK